MTGYIKYFENGSKNMSFVIKVDDVLDKYNEIWNKIKDTLNIKCLPACLFMMRNSCFSFNYQVQIYYLPKDI